MTVLGRWIEAAFEAERERDELRDILTALLFWIIENKELLELAEGQIKARWPDGEAA